MPNSQRDANRDLDQLALRLRELSEGRADVVGRIDRLIERMVEGRFHVVVLGDFKRGKSTLVNAIIGRELLPSGVVPLTAVATEVHFGATTSTVVFLDGHRLDVAPDQIAAYVTERHNPANAKGVARVEVGMDQVLGAPGLVLVDTPGAGSANEHNTAAAHAVLAEADAAVLVLSADNPLSESELLLITELGARQCRTFVVINKCDHLSDTELDEVEAFVGERVDRHLPEWSGPYRTDARAAVRPPGAVVRRARDFSTFREDLEAFVQHDLSAARRAAAVAELGRLSGSLEQALQLESAASAMDAEALRGRLERLEHAAVEGRRALDGDRVVLDHDARELVDRAGQRLLDQAEEAATSCEPALASPAATASVRTLSLDLRDVVERCVRTAFEAVRRSVEDEVATGWARRAEQFGSQVQDRIAALVGVASDLFDVHLPVVPVSPVEEQRHRFSYHFVTVESPSAPLGRWAAMLVPSGIVRRRALRTAHRRLHDEFSKHAGRARVDIAERVDAAKRELVEGMVAEYEETQRSLVQAAHGARSLLAMGEQERATRDRRLAESRELAATIERSAMGADPVSH